MNIMQEQKKKEILQAMENLKDNHIKKKEFGSAIYVLEIIFFVQAMTSMDDILEVMGNLVVG